MNRSVKLLGVVAVVCVLAMPVVSAADLSSKGEGHMYTKEPVPTGGPVNMPGAKQSSSEGSMTSASAGTSGAIAGPLALTSDDLTSTRMGGALVTPRGGSVYSPKQRAEAQIRSVIRQLD